MSRRRALSTGLGLAGLGMMALTLSACSSSAKTAEQLAGSHPLGPLYTETVSLINTYDQAIGANPELAPALGQLRDEHRQHAIAIAGLMGTLEPAISAGPNPIGPSTGPSAMLTRRPAKPDPSSSPAIATTTLAQTEKVASQNAVNACLKATGDQVAVLASIAACRATHVTALKALL